MRQGWLGGVGSVGGGTGGVGGVERRSGIRGSRAINISTPKMISRTDINSHHRRRYVSCSQIAPPTAMSMGPSTIELLVMRSAARISTPAAASASAVTDSTFGNQPKCHTTPIAPTTIKVMGRAALRIGDSTVEVSGGSKMAMLPETQALE